MMILHANRKFREYITENKNIMDGDVIPSLFQLMMFIYSYINIEEIHMKVYPFVFLKLHTSKYARYGLIILYTIFTTS